MYRRDLDGAIELSPQDERAEVSSISVSSPGDEFGWLHPASAHPFVLNGQYWQTAHPRDWPWPLAPEWRSQPLSSEYRRVMKAALRARFEQHGNLRRRLLALGISVVVTGVADGLIEELAAELREIY